MKKMLGGLFILVALVGFGSLVAKAGNLNKLAYGQGGGNPQEDATDHQTVLETYERGIVWATPVVPVISLTPAVINLTGASSTYKGPYFLAVNNTGQADCTFLPIANTTPVAGGKGFIVKAGTSKIIGPISQTKHYVSACGLTTTGDVNYQEGWHE